MGGVLNFNNSMIEFMEECGICFLVINFEFSVLMDIVVILEWIFFDINIRIDL